MDASATQIRGLEEGRFESGGFWPVDKSFPFPANRPCRQRHWRSSARSDVKSGDRRGLVRGVASAMRLDEEGGIALPRRPGWPSPANHRPEPRLLRQKRFSGQGPRGERPKPMTQASSSLNFISLLSRSSHALPPIPIDVSSRNCRYTWCPCNDSAADTSRSRCGITVTLHRSTR